MISVRTSEELSRALRVGTQARLRRQGHEPHNCSYTAQSGPIPMPKREEKSEPLARVLVVDDQDMIRDVICRVLTDEGYLCTAVPNAYEAWRYLQQNEIELVTLDVVMPGRSGCDLLRDIVEELPDVAVIMLTGRADVDIAVDTLTYGACAYLIKPINYAELRLHAKRALERRSMLIERRQYTEHLEEKIESARSAVREAHEETILRLINAAVSRDEETGAHIRRVGLCSEILARALGWKRAACDMLRIAAPMHDIGKIGIPDAILRKPGKLTEAEFEVMKQHASIGASVLSGSNSPVLQLAEQIARSHHEHWDGNGYPDAISETMIPEAARIVGIIDVYDALTHSRVYRSAMPEEEALAVMRGGRGTHFDPEMLDVFLGVLPELRKVLRKNPDERAEFSAACWSEPGFAVLSHV